MPKSMTCKMEAAYVPLPADIRHQFAYKYAWELVKQMAGGKPGESSGAVPAPCAAGEPVNAAGKKFTKFAEPAGGASGGDVENKRARAAARWRTRRGKHSHN